MKTKDGKIVKLDANECRAGNFIYRDEENHVKVMDINSQMTHRIGKHLNIGRLLEMAMKEKNDDFLKGYAALLWQVSNIVPDMDFFKDIDSACVSCVNRHKDFYGIKEDITKEEDDKILDDVKVTEEAAENLKNEENV